MFVKLNNSNISREQVKLSLPTYLHPHYLKYLNSDRAKSIREKSKVLTNLNLSNCPKNTFKLSSNIKTYNGLRYNKKIDKSSSQTFAKYELVKTRLEMGSFHKPIYNNDYIRISFNYFNIDKNSKILEKTNENNIVLPYELYKNQRITNEMNKNVNKTVPIRSRNDKNDSLKYYINLAESSIMQKRDLQSSSFTNPSNTNKFKKLYGQLQRQNYLQSIKGDLKTNSQLTPIFIEKTNIVSKK